MTTKKCQKMPLNFNCEICNFKCSKLSNFNKHLSTSKHLNTTNILQNTTEKMPLSCEKMLKMPKNYICITCGKEYKHHSSLWTHKKKYCSSNIKEGTEDDVRKLTNLILEVVKSNRQLQKQVIELSKEKTNTFISTNTNSHNKTFNLNVFLNDTCKDAMNIMDFADSLKIKISDLENVGKLGYVDGITNIIIKNLQELDISKRPLHCSDIKREILYIKDKNAWGKEKERLKEAIQHVAHKNVQMLPKWKEENPDYKRDEGKANDEYLKIIMQSMGGSDKQEDDVYQNKIISKLAKHVIIEKE
jgi:hypothetical protein